MGQSKNVCYKKTKHFSLFYLITDETTSMYSLQIILFKEISLCI